MDFDSLYRWLLLAGSKPEKGGASTRELIAGHWYLFRNLWKTASELAEIAIKEGRPVYIEWPRYCRYWNERKVKQFIKRFGGIRLDLDGCQYGVVSDQKRSRGEPILKPWRIIGFNCTPTAGLQLRCPKVHKHTPAEGSDTKRTEEYPIALVHAIHAQIADDCRVCRTTVPESCPVAYPSRGIMSWGDGEGSVCDGMAILSCRSSWVPPLPRSVLFLSSFILVSNL